LYVSTSIKIYSISRNQTITYDDGNRIKQGNPDGTTTLFLGGGAYEVHIDGQTTTVTKYYAIAGQRVMRDSSGLHYLMTDHLGSVAAVLDENGDLESDERYLPFGGLRDSTGISQTDFGFTGQRNLTDVGLMDYNARWYLPSVGRFISADPVVPAIGNPQSLNRYSYVLNSPLIFIDPRGHMPCNGPMGECGGRSLIDSPSIDPLSEDQWEIVKKEADRFGLPPELVAATIAVEIVYDTDWYDHYLDVYLQKLPLIFHYTEPEHFTAVWIHEVADLFLNGYEHYFGLLGGRGPGNGIANVHVLTAKNAEQYYAKYYPGESLLESAKDDYYRMTVLLTDEGNIHYTAAILRQLADLRTGSRRSHTNDLDDTDMEIIYSAFRADLDTFYTDIERFRAAIISPPGTFGYQIHEFFGRYRERLSWE
jgi:RHS repeat-associated protein